jgi:ectoine hydroxylase-related dioxygenase (phytanoyl-CoA dioxygenase family)
MDTSPVPGPGGICGEQGYHCPVRWTGPGQAGGLARLLATSGLSQVTQNPHREHQWARDAVTAPALLATVRALIGADIAVENSFLITKQPGTTFAVPAHQDGINDRILLDPARAAAAWLAITDATVSNGCLHIIPRSHHGGYVRYRRADPAAASDTNRPLTTAEAFADDQFVPVPLPGGQACLMDVRLVHRSGPNRSNRTRIGLNVRYVAPGAVTVRDGIAPDLFVITGTRL